MTGNCRIAYLAGSFGGAVEQRLSGFLRHRRESAYSTRICPVFVDYCTDCPDGGEIVRAFDLVVADIGVSSRVKRIAEAFVAAGKPTVVIARGTAGFVSGPKTAVLRLDETWIANEAVDYLAANGFCSIAYVAGDNPLIAEGFSMRRKAMTVRVKGAIGSEGTFSSAKLPLSDCGYLLPEDFEDFCIWLKDLALPCGIVVDSDPLAVLVVQACRKCGLSVPNQISLLGVGNCESFCRSLDPMLSSVEIDNIDGGERASILVDTLLGGTTPSPGTSFGVSKVVPRVMKQAMDADEAHLVDKARRLIQQHACDGCNVNQIVSMLNVPQRTIVRKYRMVTGRTMVDDIHLVRVATAKRLLVETDLPVSEVLVSSGYNLVASSYKVFKDLVGMSMSEWRESARKKECSR